MRDLPLQHVRPVHRNEALIQLNTKLLQSVERCLQKAAADTKRRLLPFDSRDIQMLSIKTATMTEDSTNLSYFSINGGPWKLFAVTLARLQ